MGNELLRVNSLQMRRTGVALIIILSTLLTMPPCAGMTRGSWFGQVSTDYFDHGLQGSALAPNGVTGIQSLAVIMVQFTDHNHTVGRHAIEVNLQRLNAYYRNVSYNQISVDWSVYGWYSLNRTLEFYGQDIPGGGKGDERGNLLLMDSIRAAQHDIDFHSFQHVGVVYAGSDQRVSNVTSDLWPHYWPLNLTTESGASIRGAFYVSEFAGMGSYAHEFGHSLGLPDLYSRDVTKSCLVCSWSLMDSGEWLPRFPNDSLPSGLDAWSLTQLGWVKPVELSITMDPVSVTLVPLEAPTSTRIGKITFTSTLYYLLELRVQRGVDVALPGNGILISLVNETARRSYDGYGVVNSTVISRSGDEPFSDMNRNVFVEPIDCATDECRIIAGSSLVHVSLSSMPKELEALTPFETTIELRDKHDMPLQNFSVTLFVDEKSIPLVTDMKGDTHYTIFFFTIGQHRVGLRNHAVMWPQTSVATTIVVKFPYTISEYTILTLVIILAILGTRRKRRRRAPRDPHTHERRRQDRQDRTLNDIFTSHSRPSLLARLREIFGEKAAPFESETA